MKTASIEGYFSRVSITPSDANDGGNSDNWLVAINTGDHGGQDLEIGGKETPEVRFVITGVQEMQEIAGTLPLCWMWALGQSCTEGPVAELTRDAKRYRELRLLPGDIEDGLGRWLAGAGPEALDAAIDASIKAGI